MTAGYAEGDVTKRTSAVRVLEFWTDHIPDADAKLVPVDWVRWAKVGSNGATTDEKVERIKKHNPVVWDGIRQAYERWKAGQDAPVDGTPLEAWPGISKGQLAALRLLNILSVEDLAGVNDAALDRIGMGARALRDRAQKFIAAQSDGTAAIAARLAALEEALKVANERNTELEGRLRAYAERRGPGRPRKEPTDDGGGDDGV